jgi:Inner membrane component of T3SS, cytoplasmic domain/Inner membrane component of T3SS, periplasmic domain
MIANSALDRAGQQRTNAVTASTAPQQMPHQTGAPTSPAPVRVKFEVVAGAHRGAVLLLDGTDYRIGSSSDADIVLSDPGVAPEHAVLHVERGRVRIGATGADITVEQESLPLSRGCRVNLPVSIAIGAAQIQLSDPGGSGRRHDPRILTAAGLLVGVFVAAAMAVQQGLSQIAGLTLALTAGASDIRTPAPLTADPPAGPSGGSTRGPSGLVVEEALRALNARLDVANLKNLRASVENGRLAVTGTLSPQEAANWAAIQQWFDQTYGGRIVLTTRTEPAGGPRTMPALQLQAIWYGDHPYIVTSDGEHYFIGAVLDNGWIIREIGEDRLLLAKEGETVALTYR